LVQLKKTQDDPNHGIIPRRGIEHGVVDGSVRPFNVEVPLDESSPLMVDGIHQHSRLGFCFALGNKTP
jgi:hypothetical protein